MLKGRRKGCTDFFSLHFLSDALLYSMIHAYETVMEIYSAMIEFTTLAGYDDNDTIIFLLMNTLGFFSYFSKREQRELEEIKIGEEGNRCNI